MTRKRRPNISKITIMYARRFLDIAPPYTFSCKVVSKAENHFGNATCIGDLLYNLCKIWHGLGIHATKLLGICWFEECNVYLMINKTLQWIQFLKLAYRRFLRRRMHPCDRFKGRSSASHCWVWFDGIMLWHLRSMTWYKNVNRI